GPPALPGHWMILSRPGGVKMPSERIDAMISRHLPLSDGVKPHASSGPNVSGCSGPGCVGKGCVGESTSPGTPPCGTGRSSTGNSGSPPRRTGENKVAHLGGLDECGNGSAVHREVEEHGLRRRVVVPEVVVHGAEVPAHETSGAVERDDRARVEVEAVALPTVVVGRCVAGRHVDEA